MVTRIYNPPVPGARIGAPAPDTLNPDGKGFQPPVEDALQAPRTAPLDQADLAPPPFAPAAADSPFQVPAHSIDPLPSASPTLQAGIQVQSVTSPPPTESLGLHSLQQTSLSTTTVLQDFRQTASLLSTPPELEAELNTYLRVIELESQQTKPDKGLIEATLKNTASRLDSHVETALGQPSTVVREWVDALLEQPIQWSPVKTAQEKAEPSNTQALTRLIQQATQHLKQQKPTEALQALKPAIELATEANKPDLVAKLALMGAKAATTAEQPEQTVLFLQQTRAIYQDSPEQHTKIPGLALQEGQLLERLNQPLEALKAYEAGLAISQGGPAERGALANAAGSVSVQQGRWQQAQHWYQQALAQPNQDSSFKSDIYSNMALAYRRQGLLTESEQAYRSSLSLAKQAKRPAAYAQTLKQLAGLYVEQGNTNKARALLQAMDRLNAA